MNATPGAAVNIGPDAGRMQWVSSTTEWTMSLRAAGRPDTTIDLRRYQLGRLRDHVAPLAPWDVTGDDLVRWIGGAAWSSETKRSYRSAVRSFYAWARLAGYVEVDPALALPSIRPARPEPRPAPILAYHNALSGADDRLRLMLRLACDCGLRRGEVARVHVRDLERDLTGWTLRVVGKGRRVRRMPLPDDLAREVESYAGDRYGYLFAGDVEGHLSARWVGKLVSRALPIAWTMHTLRHRFATDAYAVDRDTFTVQELLGHASPVTTKNYVQVPLDGLRSTVQAVSAGRRRGVA